MFYATLIVAVLLALYVVGFRLRLRVRVVCRGCGNRCLETDSLTAAIRAARLPCLRCGEK